MLLHEVQRLGHFEASVGYADGSALEFAVCRSVERDQQHGLVKPVSRLERINGAACVVLARLGHEEEVVEDLLVGSCQQRVELGVDERHLPRLLLGVLVGLEPHLRHAAIHLLEEGRHLLELRQRRVASGTLC